eukprot:scaffold1234_cov345-Pavlova_lutheri.AAC.4
MDQRIPWPLRLLCACGNGSLPHSRLGVGSHGRARRRIAIRHRLGSSDNVKHLKIASKWLADVLAWPICRISAHSL